MPWDLVPVEQTHWSKKPLPWLGVAALVCLALLALPRVQARYRLWAEHRGIGRAAQAYLQGDFNQAVVDARGVLKKNPHSPEATRIIAKSLEAMHSPQALAWRRELESMQGGDAENLLGLANASLQTGDFAGAERALGKLKPEEQTSAHYHSIVGKIAAHHRDAAGAETHAVEAVRREPGNDEYRVQLAAVQLTSRIPETRTAALGVLEKMIENPAQHLVALRTLLVDATSHGERSRTRELATTLAADPAANFSDKVARLGILRSTRDPESIPYLEKLEELAGTDEEQLYKLMSWMNENDLALAVLDWEGKLPAEILARPPVCTTLADAYARAANWKGLRTKIEHASWGDMEFLRFAFLCRALERLEDPSASKAAWNNALVAAQVRPEWIEVLGKVTKAWGWKQRSEETLWKLAGGDRIPRWAAESLWSAALARKDTAKLYEASKLLVKADPNNPGPRNNYVFLALLTGQTADSPNDLAADLYKQNPKELNIASTYAFSLFQQGRGAEAVTVLETFPPEQLRAPQAATYYAISLAAAGNAERADEYFQLSANAPLLPEETAIVKVLSPACRARSLERHSDSPGSAAAWNEALAAAGARPEWLELLGKMALDWKWQPQTEAVTMKLASLERCPAWASESLWKAALKTGSSAEILRAARLISTLDPKNIEVRNRLLSLQMLTGRESETAQRQSALLARENPRNAYVAATCGLGLYQQGRVDEALALMTNFTPEQLLTPSVALYHGLFLAAAGKKDDAAPFLKIAESAPLLAEERALLAKAQSGAAAPVATPRAVAASTAPAALLTPPAPIDRTRRDTLQLFKEAREGLVADSKNVIARSNYLLLALLTGQSADSARQLARALYKEHSNDATAAACYGLSLFQQGKADEAIALMEALTPEQLHDPLIALYYGHFLSGSERPEKAAKAAQFLTLSSTVPLLPEERAFLSK